MYMSVVGVCGRNTCRIGCVLCEGSGDVSFTDSHHNIHTTPTQIILSSRHPHFFHIPHTPHKLHPCVSVIQGYLYDSVVTVGYC